MDSLGSAIISKESAMDSSTNYFEHTRKQKQINWQQSRDLTGRRRKLSGFSRVRLVQGNCSWGLQWLSFVRLGRILSEKAMADPSLQSLCCIEDTPAANRTEQYKLLELYQSPFYGLCLASSIIGLLGSLYQLSLRFLAPFPRYQYFNVGLRGNNILFWLALADFNADLGNIFHFIHQRP